MTDSALGAPAPLGHPPRFGSIRVGVALLAAFCCCAARVGPLQDDVSSGLEEFARGQFAEAYWHWRGAAEAGDVTAALFLGVMYDSGQGVRQSDAAALAWYRQAALRGNASGMFNVGVMYDAGQGMAVDRAEAARWYERAASLGFPRAEYNLALLLETGDGVPRDAGRAAILFRAAAQHGLAAAREHLSRSGALPPAATRADRPDSATADFERAQAVLLTRGPAQAAQAAELFRRSGEQGNSLAEYDYAYCLDMGLGVLQDRTMAYVWYRRAALHARDGRLQAMASDSADAVRRQLTVTQLDTASRALVQPR